MWKGRLKSIFWMGGTAAEELLNGPSGPRRECAAQAFWAAAQNLGAGAIDSPRACGIIGAPTGLISRGVCGITIEKFQDIKEGDVIEAYLMEQIEV